MVGLHVIEYLLRKFGFRGYGDSHGDSNGDSCGYGMGMGIEMPSPRQPWYAGHTEHKFWQFWKRPFYKLLILLNKPHFILLYAT